MSADPEVLRGLLERVKASRGADVRGSSDWERPLDADLFEFFGGPRWDAAYRQAQQPCGCPHDMAIKEARLYAPRYTESIDAALTLVDRILPAFSYRIQTQLGGRLPVCTLHAPPEDPDASITDGRSWSRHYDGGGATPALAILAALLTALLPPPADLTTEAQNAARTLSGEGGRADG